MGNGFARLPMRVDKMFVSGLVPFHQAGTSKLSPVSNSHSQVVSFELGDGVRFCFCDYQLTLLILLNLKPLHLLRLSWHITVRDSPGSEIQSTRCIRGWKSWKGRKRHMLWPVHPRLLCHHPCGAPEHSSALVRPLQRGSSGPRFASSAFSCHLFIRGKVRVAGCKVPFLELCEVQGPIRIFSLVSWCFRNSYLWRPHTVCTVWVSGLGSQVPMRQVQTISCVLTGSAARHRRHCKAFFMIRVKFQFILAAYVD